MYWDDLAFSAIQGKTEFGDVEHEHCVSDRGGAVTTFWEGEGEDEGETRVRVSRACSRGFLTSSPSFLGVRESR